MNGGPGTRSRFRGCLVGHGVGDALGAPVEFLALDEILRRFGPCGVDGYEPWDGRPKGTYTDDTQLMRATAVGLLRSWPPAPDAPRCDPAEAVYGRYLEWLVTQDNPAENRYPGATCLAALRSGEMGTVDAPINDRKGAGGIMRVAPAGLAYEPERAFENAAEFAAVTHGHPTGYLAAGFYADLVSRVVRGTVLTDAVRDAREVLLGWEDFDETLEAVDRAVELFIAEATLFDAVTGLGEGWVAEEALGIALFCALAFAGDWTEGTLAAVNITGDSDTTGALTGALLGAMLGIDAIPGDLVRGLEDAEGILGLADDLHAAAKV